ncbi:CGGC domain protein [Poriferisphaera corsica]|uniref:CGGC domain protein n=1 Tax=Poriferisphaera corsica TaxID=2528020 RepID=A0A517YVA5_9BACT|nr:CGGC domain-containing protein [Poriferisphaera corsica]QDU34102.1 CGGC domain protein [Poriferisphaera corsica]
MKKVGIIRCQQTEHLCPGTSCFKAASTGRFNFEPFGPCEIIGFISCGGCPGKQAVARSAEMVKRGAEAIFMGTCIAKGTPIGFACPHWEQMKQAIEKKIGPNIPLIIGTHPAPGDKAK